MTRNVTAGGSGERLQGALLIGLSAVGFGAMAIFARFAYAGGADTMGVLLLRFAAAGLILLGVVRWRRVPWPRPAAVAWLAAMGGIGYVGMSWCYFAALNHAPASLVALLLYTYPTIVTVLAAIFLHERITLRKLGALLLCGLGTVLVIGPNLAASTAGASLTGIGLALAAAAIYALYIVAGTRITRGVDPVMTTTIVCISAAVVLAAVAVLSGMNGMPPRLPLSLAGWAGVAGVAAGVDGGGGDCFFCRLETPGCIAGVDAVDTGAGRHRAAGRLAIGGIAGRLAVAGRRLDLGRGAVAGGRWQTGCCRRGSKNTGSSNAFF